MRIRDGGSGSDLSTMSDIGVGQSDASIYIMPVQDFLYQFQTYSFRCNINHPKS